MQGTLVYIVAVMPDQITEIDRAKLVRLGDNRWVPLVMCKAKRPGGEEYETGFPVVIREVSGEAQLENLRSVLHQKIDQQIDQFKARFPREQSPVSGSGRDGEEDEIWKSMSGLAGRSDPAPRPR